MDWINAGIQGIGNVISWILTFWLHGFEPLSSMHAVYIWQGALIWLALIAAIYGIIKLVKLIARKINEDQGNENREIPGWNNKKHK